MRCTSHVAPVQERGVAYRVLIGIPERKNLFARPGSSWADNIKTDLKGRELGSFLSCGELLYM
jgi:hypothetical protein